MPSAMFLKRVAMLVLIIFTLIKLCSSDLTPSTVEGTATRSDILQKIEGKVLVNNVESEDWLLETTVCLDGGEYCGFLKSSGNFVIHNVPPGSYLVEVFSPNYFFESVRVDISSKNGKIRARKVNLLKATAVVHLPYPLRFRVDKQANFFEKRESWNILSMLKNPMVCKARHYYMLTLIFLLYRFYF